MTPEELQRWWKGYEPRSPTADTCPRCESPDYYNHGLAHAPFGLGIVVCADCGKHHTHVDKWLRKGLDDDLTIPAKYDDRLEQAKEWNPDDEHCHGNEPVPDQ